MRSSRKIRGSGQIEAGARSATLFSGRQYAAMPSQWQSIIAVFGFRMLGDALCDVLAPRLRGS